MSYLGLASILTEDVRENGAWSEFLNKFPDRKNVTFEETNGGLDRSHESLGAAFKTRQKGKHTVDDCVMYRDDWNGLQRHEQRVFLCGLLVPKTRTHVSRTLLPEKVLFLRLSEVFMPLCKS